MGPAFVDLFAGAGGLGLGVILAGGDLRLSVEQDATCCKTLRANPTLHRGAILEADVAKLTGKTLRAAAKVRRGESLVIVGGAPCQPFSKAAYWTDPGGEARYREARARGEAAVRPSAPTVARPDDRRSLVDHFLRLVFEARADAFVFENVPSILHPRNRKIVERFLRATKRKGFSTALVRASAAAYGVPQTRERIFILGVCAGAVSPPQPTHWLDAPAVGLLAPESVGPALERYSGSEYHEPEEQVSGRWAKHLREVPPGWNYKHHTRWAGHPDPTFEAERRFWNFLLKLHPERPSWTIAANPGPWTGPFHWSTRRLRTPELGAIQTFPHGYQFAGSRRERVRQIGNAVPPKLASKMVEALLTTMGVKPTARTGRREGAVA